MAYPATVLASAVTWWTGHVNGAVIDTYLVGPLNALRAAVPQTVTGTITIAANGIENTATINFPAGLANPPTILAINVFSAGQKVSANQTAAATASGVSVHAFTTAGNSVGTSAATITVVVVYAGT